ncbi:TIGR03084 family metal-binding protein [Streptomyces sp. NBC_01408]|uniref:TIGR03084 family metal-binding protein n=1 Tax=Streptomyces sp. NBC_01408 TaxID=2903855 RepID=UPI002252A28D|nr:TIGR03084 family metal-binding protein [Streptomyces sp. NBC_01408]MCX4691789.1 TIGR03084 family metal-binding protein [Streptomyces sp. NBC_01408]
MPDPSAVDAVHAVASDAAAVFVDLREEGRELDLLVGELPEGDWVRPTPAAGWSIGHQIAHLHWTDRAALLSLTDATGFGRMVEEALKAPDSFVDEGAGEGAALPPAELLARWRTGRAALDEALAAASPDTRFPWYGPPMKAASMASARLMETWAHGQDVADALSVRRAPTARLRHVARIGVRARDYAYAVRGLPAPAGEFRVELAAPGGAGVWAYGPPDAPQRIAGPALDFCLLVTQRAHRADLALTATGPDADAWLDIAQAFAGPAGPGRAPEAAR